MNLLKCLIVTVALLLGSIVNAQVVSKVEEIHAQKWEYMVDKAQLTPQQEVIIKPIFLAYEKNSWKQHEENRAFFRSGNRKDGGEKPSFSEINDRYADVELIQAQNFKNYHLKLRRILPPETLYNYYMAERDFKRKLLRELPDRQNNAKK